MLAEGGWVRLPACGTEDSRCACRATCRRSAHGRRAGTWAALSPFGPGQSPPGRLSRCWPAQQQQDGAAWCSISHCTPFDKWHSLTLRPIHRHLGSALIGLARFILDPLHLCRVTCNGLMCAQQWQDSTRAERYCNVSAYIVRHVRRGGGGGGLATSLPSMLGSPFSTRTVVEGRLFMASAGTPCATDGPAHGT